MLHQEHEERTHRLFVWCVVIMLVGLAFAFASVPS
jgi:hypothetical protein